MRITNVLCLTFLVGCSCFANTIGGQPCASPSAPLSTYLDPSPTYPNGCDIGQLNYQFLEFGKLTPKPNGGYNYNTEGGTLTPDNVVIAPTNNPLALGISIRSDAFLSDFSSENELYYFSYAVDPPPILLGEQLELEFDFGFRSLAPLAAGNVQITQYLCPDALFVRTGTSPDPASNQCASPSGTGTVDALVLRASFDNPSDAVSFGRGVPLVWVHMFIELSGDLTNSNFRGIGDTMDTLVTPEPMSVGLTAAGLGLVAIFRKRLQRG